MTQFKNGNILLVNMDSRLETSNAAEAEKFIMDAIAAHSPTNVILNADKLEYISSSGLRVLLKVKKAVENTQLVNVCSEVYDVLEMTGFTEILSVQKAFRQISVDGCDMIGKGGFGETYQLNTENIVKVYNEGIPYEDIVSEKENAKAAFIAGVPTAIPFDTVRVGNRFGNVYELINSRPLAEVICADPFGIDKYAQQAADLLKTLSTTHAQPGKFRRFVDIAAENLEATDNYVPGEKLFTPVEHNSIERLFNCVPERDTLIHGDFHTHNIFSQNDELLLIDMADTSTGHPLFELGNMYLTFMVLSKLPGERGFHLIGLPNDKAAYFYNKVLELFLPGFTEKEMNDLNDVCAVLAQIRMMIVAVSSAALNAYPIEVRRKSLHDMKDKLNHLFFDHAESIIETAKRLTGKF